MEKSQKWAFSFALTLGGLSLLAAFVNPAVGALNAIIFFAIAWGIRRGQPWAAISAIYIALSPVIRAAFQLKNGDPRLIASFAISAAIMGAAACVFALAAVSLWKRTAKPQLAPAWQALLLVAILSEICVHAYSLPTTSMENTLMPGDSVLADAVSMHLGRDLQREDLIAFHYPVDPRQIFVKRIAGVPGDRLRIQNKQLYRNGQAVNEPYAIHVTGYVDSYRDNFPSTPKTIMYPGEAEMLRDHVRNGEVLVPPGKYFVLGDNRDDSLDSRYWGFISKQAITGRPFLVFQSVNQQGAHNSIRWNRFFQLL